MLIRITLFCAVMLLGCEGGDAAPDASRTGDAATVVDAGFDAGSAMDGGSDAGAVMDGGGDAGADGGTDAAVDAGSGERCEEAIDVTGGGTFAGTTTGRSDDHAPDASGDECPFGGATSGPDVAYVLRPSVVTTYEVTVTPAADSGYDPMLYALAACDATDCVDGTILNGPDEQESITVEVPAGGPVFIIVDGETFTDGAYTLDVTVE